MVNFNIKNTLVNILHNYNNFFPYIKIYLTIYIILSITISNGAIQKGNYRKTILSFLGQSIAYKLYR